MRADCRSGMACYVHRGMNGRLNRWVFGVMTLAGLAMPAVPPAIAKTPSVAQSGKAGQERVADIEAIFRQFELFGTWAVDCTRPPAPANPHVSVSTIGAGLVIETHDLGPGNMQNRYSVLAAERLSDSSLALFVIFQPGTEFEERQRLELVVRSGTRRTTFNQPEGEPVRVRDGVAVAVGIRTPVLRKCG